MSDIWFSVVSAVVDYALCYRVRLQPVTFARAV